MDNSAIMWQGGAWFWPTSGRCHCLMAWSTRAEIPKMLEQHTWLTAPTNLLAHLNVTLLIPVSTQISAISEPSFSQHCAFFVIYPVHVFPGLVFLSVSTWGLCPFEEESPVWQLPAEALENLTSSAVPQKGKALTSLPKRACQQPQLLPGHQRTEIPWEGQLLHSLWLINQNV